MNTRTTAVMAMMWMAMMLGSAPAWAIEAKVVVNYDHPTTNADGTPLTDLAYSEVIIKDLEGAVMGEPYQYEATDATGGEHVRMELPVEVEANTVTPIRIEVRAYDTQEVPNASDVVSVSHDVTGGDTVAPGVVINVIITSTTTSTTITTVP